MSHRTHGKRLASCAWTLALSHSRTAPEAVVNGARPGANQPDTLPRSLSRCPGVQNHRASGLPPHRDVRPVIRHRPSPLPVVYASPDAAREKLNELTPTMLVTWDCTPVTAFTRFTSLATWK